MRNYSKYHLKINERFGEWGDAALSWLRILVPVVMLNILTFAVHSVYISEIKLEISSITMRCVTLDSVYMRLSQNSQPNSDTPDMNSRKER